MIGEMMEYPSVITTMSVIPGKVVPQAMFWSPYLIPYMERGVLPRMKSLA
jgi:hypothetical protein